MGKKRRWLALLWLFIPLHVFSEEPLIKKPRISIIDNELMIIFQLFHGLDIDRMSIIEKGLPVTLKFKLKIHKKNLLLFDDIVPLSKEGGKKIEEIILTKELTYDYITKNYIVKIKKNFSKNIKIERFYAGENLRKSYKKLKKKYFNKKVIVYINLNRFKLVNNNSYYATILAEFKAVPTINFPLKIPNPFNFKTAKVDTNILKYIK